MLKSLLFISTFQIGLFGALASASDFQVRYRDKSGLEWGQVIGELSNGCSDANIFDGNYGLDVKHDRYNEIKCAVTSEHQVTGEFSAAAQACQDIGGKLPTADEYDSLIREFPHVEDANGPELTDGGKDQLFKSFGDFDTLLKQSLFWTSDTFNDGSLGLGFIASWGKVDRKTGTTRSGRYPTRCVRFLTPTS